MTLNNVGFGIHESISCVMSLIFHLDALYTYSLTNLIIKYNFQLVALIYSNSFLG